MKTLLTLASFLAGIGGNQGWAMEPNPADSENNGRTSQFGLLRSLPPAIFEDVMGDLDEQGQTCAGVTCKEIHKKDDPYRVYVKRNAIIVPGDKQYRNLSSFIKYLYKFSRVKLPVTPNDSRHSAGDSKSTESGSDSKTKDIGSLITQIHLGLLQPEPPPAGALPGASVDASVGNVLKAIQTIFPNLQDLRLANTDLQESHLEIIGQMKNLRVLELGGTSFYHPGIRHLSNLTEMRRLDLSAPCVAPSKFNPAAQFSHLSKMHHLMYLDFTRTPQTARAFQEWILSITDDSNGFAAYRRAVMLYFGTDDHKGPPLDAKLAIASCEKAAQLGNPLAQTQLAELYQKGIGVKKDHAKAYTWFKKAHLQGHAEARNGYWETRFSRLTPKELASKHATFLRHPEPAPGSKKEHFNYQFELGWMYLKGLGVTQNDLQAVFWLRKAAEKGLADAQFRLGFMYAEGRGVVQDNSQALAWYRKAADQGLAAAQYELGLMYSNGDEVDQDALGSVEWFRKAAEQGLADAQKYLGIYYYSGYGVERDGVRAVHWFEKAAEQGSFLAQHQLGYFYYLGLYVDQDYTRAAEWFRKAAERGLPQGQYHLGLLFSNGLGVDQDYVQAAEWYTIAAENGLAVAQFSLGALYENGHGLDLNLDEAIRWYRLAAAQEDEEAQARLDALENGEMAEAL